MRNKQVNRYSMTAFMYISMYILAERGLRTEETISLCCDCCRFCPLRLFQYQWFIIFKKLTSHRLSFCFNTTIDGAGWCHIFKFTVWTVSIIIIIIMLHFAYYAKIVVRVLTHIVHSPSVRELCIKTLTTILA
jgi:hypothetical protein